MATLRTARDFYELADAYLARAAAEGVRHAELFFDPQAHTGRRARFAPPAACAAACRLAGRLAASPACPQASLTQTQSCPHPCRGVPFEEFFPGLLRAVQDAPVRHGLTARLLMCILRDLGPAAASELMEQVGLAGWWGRLRALLWLRLPDTVWLQLPAALRGCHRD